VPLNTRFREDDMAYVVGHAEATTLIQGAQSGPIDYLGMTRAVLPGLGSGPQPGDPCSADFPLLRRVIVVGDGGGEDVLRWDDLLAGAAHRACGDQPDALARAVADRSAAVDPEDTALIVYTSGTTGFPKGAMHSHRCLRAQRDRAARLRIDEHDAFLCYLPLFHLYGLAEMCLMFTVTGSRLALTETFDAEESAQLIQDEGITMVHGFDVHYQGLLEARDRLGLDHRSLRLGTMPAGSDGSLPVARRVHAELVPIVSAYGLTEGWCCVTVGMPDGSEEQCTMTSGCPMPDHELRVVDPDTGQVLPPGAEGEIQVRSYMVMQGYFREPQLTAEAIDADGWLRTGDAGVLRPDGYLRFLGRYKDMLKVGGENVSPLEVEGYLLQRHPLRQIAVVGVPDERLGEVPVAFVEVAAGDASDGSALEQAFAESCRGHIASYKIPRRVFVVEALPMTASGKVQKHLLRDRARALLDSTP
jgi:fatty-acyl-CoA synthase